MSDAVPGTLIGFAPVAGEIGHLLRMAIDAEQVGATLLQLPVDQPALSAAVAGLREHTRLVVTCHASVAGTDDLPADLTHVISDSGDLPAVVAQVGRLVTDHPAGVLITGRGRSTLPALLATLAAGGHVLVEPPEPAATGASAFVSTPTRDHVALIARASGLARIAGRPPLDHRAARVLLGLG